MKRNLYNHNERWNRWFSQANASGVKGVSSENAVTILSYLRDMEVGVNVGVGSHKGPRTTARLNTLRSRMIFFARIFQDEYGVNDLTMLTEEVVFRFFADMHNGTLRSVKGKTLESTNTHVKLFKAFWHWHQKINRKKGVMVPDITFDLGSYPKKPLWVYLDEEKIQQLCSAARFDYRVLFSFMLDSGIRPGGELLNTTVSDLTADCKELNIRA